MGSLFTKKYAAEIKIDAASETIWKVLTAFSEYHQWNLFTPKVEVEWKRGGKVHMIVNMKEGKKPVLQTEYFSKINPPTEFAYGMHWGIFLKAERIQRLTPLPEGKVLYFTEDVISGLMCPVVHWMYGKYIKAGFEKVAIALKNYCEKI